MRRGLRIWLICALSCVCQAPAQAAWLQSKGTSLIISSLSSYHADKRFGADGLRTDASGYRKQELSIYGVYGASNGLTLGAQPSFFRLGNKTRPGATKTHMKGLSYVELFARAGLFKGDYWILSTQALVKIPGSGAFDRDPVRKSTSRDLEGRLLFGRSGRLPPQLLNLKYFTSFEAGYRLRDRDTADQWRADATFGANTSRNYQILFQSFNTISVDRRAGELSSAYDIYKAQVSVVRELPWGMAIQFGGLSEISGRNTGAGHALFTALWSRF
jgi:hypothetical protein